jgi:predicted DCC family thiol-disulfide oxidoreductase YuxK
MPSVASRNSPPGRDWAESMDADNRIVVFDGLCNLCTGGARWFEHHPAKPPFLLVPMQSDRGRALSAQHGYDPDDPLTFLVLDGRQCLTQSDAWIHLIVAAGGAWRLMHAARIIPRAWRDSVYRVIARNRYRWFGRRRVCYLPQTPPESHSPAEPSARSGTRVGRR